MLRLAVLVLLAAALSPAIAASHDIPSAATLIGGDNIDGPAVESEPSLSIPKAVANGPTRLLRLEAELEHVETSKQHGGALKEHQSPTEHESEETEMKKRMEGQQHHRGRRQRSDGMRIQGRRLQNGDPTDFVNLLSSMADTPPDEWSGEEWAVGLALLVLGVVGLFCCACMCLIPMCCGGRRGGGGGGGCLQDLLMCFCCWELCCRGGEDIGECCGGGMYQGDLV